MKTSRVVNSMYWPNTRLVRKYVSASRMALLLVIIPPVMKESTYALCNPTVIPRFFCPGKNSL